jgi:CheY-like chemotaxis protein
VKNNSEKVMEIQKNTILVIEDDEAICKLISYILQKSGYSVIICKTGIEAFNWLKNNLPVIVLCDIALPDINGEKILTFIRRLDRSYKIPVVAVTGIARTGDKERFLKRGFTGYISKPFNTSTFVSEIQKFIE